MNRFLGCTCLLAAALAATSARGAAPPAPTKWQWVYAPCNFQVDARGDELVALAKRAKTAGYNGLLVTDSKFARLQERPKNYYANLARFKKAADELGLDIVPAVCPVGYSNDILQNDPNQAEGIAVRDAPFIVRGKEAVLSDRENLLPGGSFEQAGPKGFTGWDWMDGFGQVIVQDTAVKHSGAASARLGDFRKGEAHGNCRLVKKLTLTPWRQYHLSVWIKTDAAAPAGDIRLVVLAPDGRSLNYAYLGVKPTQDWTQHHVVFNSMEYAGLSLYVGIWGGKAGTIWIDDAALEPCAGVNMLRREGCPVRVTSDDGKQEYAEGRDFERWEYPKMGRVPWAGEFEPYHPEPPLRLAAGTRIRDGERLRVSFYHTVLIHEGQISGCLRSEPLFGYMETEVRLLKQYLAPKKFFMRHDELRVAGQCGLCRKEGVTAGQVLAENVRRCAAMIRKIEPEAEIFVWSDMFDPHHNAVDKYYLVGSTLAGAWEGLDPSIRIANWNSGHRDQSLPFFAGRGHKQILAAYYDAADTKAQLEGWLNSAAKVQGVEGVMYTTWQQNYKDVEAFAKVLRGGM
jgi:hypothetical protein